MNSKVLILDDDISICKIYTLMLNRLGVEADAVVTGEEVVQRYVAARNAGAPYAGVFLDLTVKDGMGGVETLKELKTIDPGVYAVVASGSSRESNRGQHHDMGFSDTLLKPFRLQDVEDCVNRMKAASAP